MTGMHDDIMNELPMCWSGKYESMYVVTGEVVMQAWLKYVVSVISRHRYHLRRLFSSLWILFLMSNRIPKM